MASLRRLGSRLTKKKTTKLRHSIVRSMTPRRRRMNESMPPSYAVGSPRVISMCLPAGRPGEALAPLPELRSLSLVQPDLVELQLEGLVHEQALHVVCVVPVERAPEWLDQDT